MKFGAYTLGWKQFGQYGFWPAFGASAFGQGVGGINALSPAKLKLVAAASDVKLAFIGDSTGNETTEWIYLFAAWLATLYPAYTVKYYLWVDGSGYGAATTIASGSGAYTLHVYNCSVAGTGVDYVDAGRLTGAITNVDPDLVVWSHGKNGYISDAVTIPEWKGTVDNVRLRSPHANVAYVLQAPNRDDSAMDLPVAAWRTLQALRGDELIIDVYSVFIAAGKPSGWYTDNLHPNATGEAQWLAVVQAAWSRSSVGLYPRLPAWFDTKVTNMLANGQLASSGGSVPTGWTGAGTLTYSREGTIVFPGDADSLKLQGSGAAQTRIFQTITDGTKMAQMAGQTVTLTVLEYVPTGATSTVGRIGLSANGTGSPSSTSRTSTQRRDGWIIWCVSLAVPANATAVTASLYQDSNSTPDTNPAYFARATLSVGNVPRDTL